MSAPRQRRALAAFPFGDVWGVGRQYAAALEELGIRHALALREADASFIRRRFGVVLARTQEELWEISCLPLEETVPPRDQICSSRSFGAECFALDELLGAVSSHVASAACKLRRQQAEARRLTVFFMTSLFAHGKQNVFWHDDELSEPTADTLTLTQTVTTLVRSGFGYRKADVTLSGIVPAGQGERDLFAGSGFHSFRRAALMQTKDELARRSK